jgi:ProP effector
MNAEQWHADAARAIKVIIVLQRLWPECFAILEARRKPLALGIREELLQQFAPAIRLGRISERDLALALRYYTHSPRYLQNTREGVARIGLDGRPRGSVNGEEAAWARLLLERRLRRKLTRDAATHAAVAEQDVGVAP